MIDALKAVIRALVSRLGYQIIRGGPPIQPTPDSPWGTIIPWASYSPWANDSHFVETYRAIQGDTLVDLYRCYELWDLVGQSRHLEGALIEIGVWRGGTGGLIAKRAELTGIREPVYLCDTFAGVVKASSRDSYYKGGEHGDASRAQVEELLHDRLGLRNAVIVQGVFPEESASLVHHDRFRFCHIDVDVYDSANDILSWIWDKLVVGGVIVYDDYGFPRTSGITRHVDEHRDDADRVTLYNLNGHAIVVKVR
jgi:O-methyltransferase